MTRPIQSNRYSLATTSAGASLLLSAIPLAMLKHISKRQAATYDSLAKATSIPRNSLYVFAQRMEEAGLIERDTKLINKRWHTTITTKVGVSVSKVQRI